MHHLCTPRELETACRYPPLPSRLVSTQRSASYTGTWFAGRAAYFDQGAVAFARTVLAQAVVKAMSRGNEVREDVSMMLMGCVMS